MYASHQHAVLVTILNAVAFLPSSAAQSTFTGTPAFNFNNATVLALCQYPISGNYGLLNRMLFYCTIVFALVAKNHDWLIGGALAAAFTYSGSAAIHACLVVWRGPAYGDSDVQAIMAILSTSCIIAVPMLNWSSTLRRIGARPIVLYWGFFVTVGFVCVFATIFGYIRYVNSSYNTTYTIRYEDTLWFPFDLSIVNASPMSNISQILNCAPSSKLNSTGPFIVTPQFITDYGCQDPCPSFTGTSVFRTVGELQLLTYDQVNVVLGTGTVKEMKTKSFVYGYQTYGMIILPYILVQGFWAALFGRRSPAQVRDNIYIFISGLKLWNKGFKRKNGETSDRSNHRQRPGLSGLKKWIAKYWALLVYAGAISIILICPPLFIVNLAASELSLNQLIESEPPTAIGQWFPWASTVLILLAALVGKYHDDAVSSLVGTTRYVLWKLRGKLTKSERLVSADVTELDIPQAAEEGVKHRLQRFWGPVKAAWEHVQDECLAAKEFWKDPEKVARYSLRHPIRHDSGSSAIVAQIHSHGFPIDLMGMEMKISPKSRGRTKDIADDWADGTRHLPPAHLDQQFSPADTSYHAMRARSFAESLPRTASLYEDREDSMLDGIMMATNHGHHSTTESLLKHSP